LSQSRFKTHTPNVFAFIYLKPETSDLVVYDTLPICIII